MRKWQIQGLGLSIVSPVRLPGVAFRGTHAVVIILCACVSLALVQDGSNTVTASVASGGGG